MVVASGTMSPCALKGNEPPFTWNTVNEIKLYQAMIGHKPAGLNKHFNMICISEKFSNAVEREVPSECIWKYLETLYDLEMIDHLEKFPFPNEEREFSLPESEYGPLMKLKAKEPVVKLEEPDDRSASPRNSSRSVSRASSTKESSAKQIKKEPVEKSSKNQKEAQAPMSGRETPTSSRSSDASKTDVRRDSKDSTSSTKDSKSSVGSAAKVTPAKESKSSKPSRASIAGGDKSKDTNKTLDDSLNESRSTKRPTRGSMKAEEATPPARRRRI